jgi:hypothetical protein
MELDWVNSMVEAYFDWTGSCRFDWLDGVDLKLRSSWSSNSLARFSRYNLRIEPINDINNTIQF